MAAYTAGFMTRVTCRLTANNRDQLRNPIYARYSSMGYLHLFITYLRNHTSDLHRISVHVTYGHGLVLLWRRSDTLRISGFMYDIIFLVSA